jgi:hypothetical protein
LCRRSGPGQRLAGTLAAYAIGLVAASGAQAATDTIVTLRGEIVPACSVTGLSTSFDLGNLTASGTGTLGFATTCNAPFRYSLASVYGGMRHSAGATAPPGFSALLPYTVRMILPTDSGTIDNTCTSSSILASATTCSFSDSGSGIAINSASELRLGWTGAPNLLGGSYSDTLTVTVGIRP